MPGGKITPAGILKLTPAKMRKLGLSKQKTAYIRDLARKTQRGKVQFEALAELADHEVIEHLTQVKGIGVWTAHMFLIFALQRLDVLPTGRPRRAHSHSQGVRDGGAAASQADRGIGRDLAAVLFGGELVPVAESGESGGAVRMTTPRKKGEEMTIDERLDRLTERHEALSQSLELMAAHNDREHEKLREDIRDLVRATRDLLQLAQSHEHRLDRLEGRA